MTETEPAETTRRRRRQRVEPAPGREVDYRRLNNPFEPSRILSDDQVGQIHTSALELLASLGIKVLEPESRSILANAGCAVDEDSQMVTFDPGFVTAAVESAPADFVIRSRDGSRDVDAGGRSLALLPVAGPPHAMDLDRGRRAGSLSDFRDFLKLTQSFDVLHGLAPCVEPQDVPLEERHLEMTLSQLELSDKIPFIYSRGAGQVADCLEMIRIASGLDRETFAKEPRVWSVINTNSPRQLDIPMCQGIIEFARQGQLLVITPFTLAGAMAPVSLAGALTLQHAEAMAGIALAQTIRPGTPVIYGAFTSNVDMRSGAPAFGTPEAYKSAIASGQLARHLGLPWRSSGVSTSNTPDAQGAYETLINTYGALQGGANWVIHAAGWLESGLSASYEKFILDVEVCQIIAETLTPLQVDPAEIGLDAVSAVDPGGHFFGIQHTLDRYRSAFYEPLVFERSNFEQWTEDGARTSLDRANPIWKKTLADFEPPHLDETARLALEEFVTRRKSEGGALPGE